MILFFLILIAVLKLVIHLFDRLCYLHVRENGYVKISKCQTNNRSSRPFKEAVIIITRLRAEVRLYMINTNN